MSTTPIQLEIEFIQPKSGEDIKLLSQEELKLKKASQDFEALFLSYLLKSMRETAQTDKNSLFGSSRAEKIYTSMLDEKYAQEMAKGDGMGISKVVFEQLRGTLDAGKIAADAKNQVVTPADEVQSAYSSEDSVANTDAVSTLQESVQPDDNAQQPEVPIVTSADAQHQTDESKLPSETKQNSPSDSAGQHPYTIALSNSTGEIIAGFYNPPTTNDGGLHQEIVVEAVVPATIPSESTKSVEQLPAEGTSSKQQSANKQEIVTATQAHVKQTESNPENRQVDTLIAESSKQPSMASEKQLNPNLESPLRLSASLRVKSTSTIAASRSQTTESESPTVLYIRQLGRIAKPTSDVTSDNTVQEHADTVNDIAITQLTLSDETTQQMQIAQNKPAYPSETQLESSDVQVPQVESQNPSSEIKTDKAAETTSNVIPDNTVQEHADTVDNIEPVQLTLSDENTQQTQTAQNKAHSSENVSGIELEQANAGKTTQTLNSSPPATDGIPLEEGEANVKSVSENVLSETNIERADVQAPQVESQNPDSAIQIDRAAKPDSDFIPSDTTQFSEVVRDTQKSTESLQLQNSNNDSKTNVARDVPEETIRLSATPRDVLDSSQVGETKSQIGREQVQNPFTDAASSSPHKEANNRLNAKLPQEATNIERNISPIDDKPPVAKSEGLIPAPTGEAEVLEAKVRSSVAVVQSNLLEEETDSLKSVSTPSKGEGDKQPSNQLSTTLNRGGRVANPTDSKSRQLTDANVESNRGQNEDSASGEVKGRSSLFQTVQKFEPLLAAARSVDGQSGLSQSQRMDILRNAVLEQVVQKMRIVRTDTNSRITIQLEPPELGRLNMRMVLEGNTLTARFEAQNEFVANIIRGNFAQLNTALSHHGIKLSGFEVTVSGGQSQLFHDNQDSNPSYIKDRRRRTKDDRIKGVDTFIPVTQSQQHIVDYRL